MGLYQDVNRSMGDIPLKFRVYLDSKVSVAWLGSKKEIDNKFIFKNVGTDLLRNLPNKKCALRNSNL